MPDKDKNKKNNIPREITTQLISLEEKKVELATKQAELQAQQNDLAKQQDSNTYHYSLKVLEAKQENAKGEKELIDKIFSRGFWFAGYFTLIATALIIASFHYNKEQFIYECIKVTIPLVVGWIGGGAWVKHQTAKRDNDDSSPNVE
eukprot:Anaeramoba_ignava/a483754_16.p1 GENE.a483754_16~~a483754_16.p1  ORF type:complete len:147 (-),score=25.33 a483754_16:14-454(-)